MRRTGLQLALLLSFAIGTSDATGFQFDYETKSETRERIQGILATDLELTERVSTLKELFDICIKEDNLEAEEIADEMLQLSIESQIPDLIAQAYIDLGKVYTKKAEFLDSFEAFEIALEFVELANSQTVYGDWNYAFGLYYQELRLPTIAKTYLLEAEEQYEQPVDKLLARIERTRSELIERNFLEVQEQLPLLLISLPSLNEQVNADYLQHYLELSKLYVLTSDYETATEILDRITPLVEHLGYNSHMGALALTRAIVDLANENYEGARGFAEQAYFHFTEQGESAYIHQTLLRLERIYAALGDYEKAYGYAFQRNQRIQTVADSREAAITQRILSTSSENKEIESLLQQAQVNQQRANYLIYGLIVLLVILLSLVVLLRRTYNQIHQTKTSLEELNQDKNHFIGVVSHDLRSPLNSIMVLSEFLRDDAGDVDADTQHEYGSIIFQATQQMQQLLNNMLDVNKIETNSTALTLVPVDLTEVLTRCVDTISILGRNKGIDTTLKLPKNLPNVLGEASAIYRVLENLISNAYKFSPQHSKVTVSAKETNSVIELTVNDQGPGLTDVDKAKLFKKFEKLSATPTGNEKSTGLGLYIVKNLVQQMNGTILIESDLGTGTTFKVLLNKA